MNDTNYLPNCDACELLPIKIRNMILCVRRNTTASTILYIMLTSIKAKLNEMYGTVRKAANVTDDQSMEFDITAQSAMREHTCTYTNVRTKTKRKCETRIACEQLKQERYRCEYVRTILFSWNVNRWTDSTGMNGSALWFNLELFSMKVVVAYIGSLQTKFGASVMVGWCMVNTFKILQAFLTPFNEPDGKSESWDRRQPLLHLAYLIKMPDFTLYIQTLTFYEQFIGSSNQRRLRQDILKEKGERRRPDLDKVCWQDKKRGFTMWWRGKTNCLSKVMVVGFSVIWSVPHVGIAMSSPMNKSSAQLKNFVIFVLPLIVSLSVAVIFRAIRQQSDGFSSRNQCEWNVALVMQIGNLTIRCRANSSFVVVRNNVSSSSIMWVLLMRVATDRNKFKYR